ncbi:MAG TPA: Ig-like domain-containing protein [Jatrophihabitantaceae bacterium]|nr:Ig-like domain-containing protein [Jatrophihabitantaceae bacterium]
MVPELPTSDVTPRVRRAPGAPTRQQPRRHSRYSRWAVLAAVTAAGLLAAACTSSPTVDGSPIAKAGTDSSGNSSSPVQQPFTPSVPDAVIQISTKSTNVNPATPIEVTAENGKLTSVSLRNPEGKDVKGALSDDGTSWKSGEALGYSKSYTLKAVAENADGKVVRKSATLTTLTPNNLTMPYLNTTGGQSLHNGATYGVGIVPVVHFDEQITDRKAAERALVVDAVTPGGHHLTGAWNWVDSQNVHWRPEVPAGQYLPAGTHVTVRANVYGVQVGPGLYGQADQRVSFTIGRKLVAVADDKTHTVTVTWGQHKRVMPTSMGKHLYVPGSNGQVSLWTMSGTYTVIGKEDPAIMSSASFGLPANSEFGYAPEKVYKATRISTDGIYLHSAPWSIWAQGNTDTSHGCLNLSPDNAAWFYNASFTGDVVIVKDMGGPKIQIWQNGDWSVPWSQWVKGSALH